VTITITAFAASPDRGQGLARDTRVRWALAELGLDYDVRLVSFEAMKAPPHLALNPFGQIPTLEEGGLALFETGAIILHLASHHPGLLPEEGSARARAIGWMFAALSTIEPPIVELDMADLLERDAPWSDARRRLLIDRLDKRLDALAAWLGDVDWLEGDFSAGDLMMIDVLRRLAGAGVIERYPTLAAYVARGESRPAFKRAFAAQLAVFERGGSAANLD